MYYLVLFRHSQHREEQQVPVFAGRTRSEMSATEAEGATVDASDLLALDDKEFEGCVKKYSDANGEFDLKRLVGVRKLSKSQRSELSRRLG